METDLISNPIGWAERLRKAFEKTGWTKAELARRSRVSYDNVNKYLRGQVQQPRGDAMERIAKALNLDPLYLMTGVRPGPAVSEAAIPIRGRVAAGVWMEVETTDNENLDWLPFNPFPHHPSGSVYALIVDGDSMDRIAPDGATIICIDIAMTGVSLREGDVAIVERRRGQEGLREVTAKRVDLIDGTLWLVPQSTNPKWESARYRLADCRDDTEIRVIAKLEYILRKP